MPVRFGARRASTNGRWSLVRREIALLAIGLLCALAVQLAPGSIAVRPVRADTPAAPKAVFIVGPTGDLTDMDLTDAERMAKQAEAAGMDVHRVFYPHATWENVLANIQDANLVVYMGHGYGWPSPYTKNLTETRQDGMGLNSYDGSGKSDYTYYGATRLREYVHLAPNAIVYLNHLCYAAGNGEPGMTIPKVDLAQQRVDNMASGWLSIGARAVFAFGWWQKLNYPAALMNTDESMDDLFMTRATGAYAGSPAGYTDWNEARFDSERTPGATSHLDPHKKYGYYRSVTGDLAMTAADFRSTATGQPGGGEQGSSDPPEITSLSANGSNDGPGVQAGETVSFHPNGDGIDDELVITHTVSRSANLDATVADSSGAIVRKYSIWSANGTTTSTWNGKNNSGSIVPDGRYTLTYVPRDDSGATGDPVSVDALVLTAIKLGKPSAPALFARDNDGLAKSVKVSITVTRQAQVSFKIVDEAGTVVRTVRPMSSSGPAKLSFAWDGKEEDESWAPDGWYESVVTATTDLGTYSQARTFFAGAFRIASSINSPQRGGSLKLTINSTELLSGAPVVHVAQPGVAPWTATAKRVDGKKYKVTINLDNRGDAGTLVLDVTGVDKSGGHQDSTLSLQLR